MSRNRKKRKYGKIHERVKLHQKDSSRGDLPISPAVLVFIGKKTGCLDVSGISIFVTYRVVAAGPFHHPPLLRLFGGGVKASTCDKHRPPLIGKLNDNLPTYQTPSTAKKQYNQTLDPRWKIPSTARTNTRKQNPLRTKRSEAKAQGIQHQPRTNPSKPPPNNSPTNTPPKPNQQTNKQTTTKHPQPVPPGHPSEIQVQNLPPPSPKEWPPSSPTSGPQSSPPARRRPSSSPRTSLSPPCNWCSCCCCSRRRACTLSRCRLFAAGCGGR